MRLRRGILPLLFLLAAHGAAGAVTSAPATDTDTLPAPPAQVELYLQVSINGEDSGAILPFVQGPQGLRCPAANLAELGLDPQLLGVAGQDVFDLDRIPGLRYDYDARNQRLDLRLADSVRQPQQLRARRQAARAPLAADASRGLLLNYSLHAQVGNTRALDAVTELRWFDRNGVLSNTGAAVLTGERGYVRYDTTWTRSDPDTLQTLEIGDIIVPSLSWSRALRLGGIQWRRNFALRPDLLTYPVASYGGSAVVPSSVSLYVNGIRQFQADVGGGPFQVRDIAGLSGAGQATIVTEDALGRVVSTTLPLYVDTRLLEAGLSDYALSLGVPRRGYGAAPFSYDNTPVASASLRHGASDALTLEAHAEAGRGQVTFGSGLLVRLGQAGVASAALAASAGQARGAQATLGYQYVAQRFALDAETLRASAGYGDLGAGAGAPNVRASDRLNLSMALAGGRSAGIGFINYRVPDQPAARIVNLSLSSQLPYGMQMTLSAYRDLRRTEARGLQATLSLPLGGRAAGSASVGSQNGERITSLTASAAPDFGGGFGWNVQRGSFGAQRYDQAQLQYLGSAGQLSATTQSAGSARATTLELSGSLVAMDGAVLPARHVGRGFALVSTGVADVPVLQESRVIGRTDGAGRLLVPDLTPYSRNEIAIDVSALPADVRVPTVRQSVAPRQSSGVLARFALERYAAATVIVHGADGKPLPVGTPARLDGGVPTLVGYDGVVFVEGIRPHNTLVLGEGTAACTVRFDQAPAAGGALPLIGPLICDPKEKTP